MSTEVSTPIVSHSGIRGRPGMELSPAVVAGAVQGLGALLRLRGEPATIALARDARPEGRDLAALVGREAARCGIDVVDVGVTSSPAAKLFARRRRLGGAVIVTGSHLGQEWNGLKFVAGPDWWPVDPSTLPPPGEDEAVRPGALTQDSAASAEHAAAVCDAVDAEAIRAARLSVAWTGSAGDAPGLVLERLGCESAGGRPGPSLHFDPDGDRLVLADEGGNDVDPEAVLPLVALSLDARTVVAGADTSRMIDVVVGERGGEVSRVEPGELNLLRGLAARHGDLAGEGNGGVVNPRAGMARDGLAAAVVILELIATDGRSLSELVDELPRFSRRRSTLPCAEREAATALQNLADRLHLAAGDPHAGLHVAEADCWGLVRRSATEPVLRITVEADDDARADTLHAELTAALTGA